MNQLRAVKMVVMALTFLLVLGTLLAFSQLYEKSRAAKAPLAEELSLGQPAGSVIEAVAVAAQGDLALVTVKGGGLSDRVVLLDVKAGRKVSTVRVDGE